VREAPPAFQPDVSAKERLMKSTPHNLTMSYLYGGPQGNRPAAINPTSVACKDLMAAAEAWFPEAHLKPEAMARLALAGGTRFVYDAIIGLDLGVWGTLIFMNLIWIFLGFFIDWLGILFLTIPIFLPVILSMGLNPIWFGVLYCMNMQVSYLSPPFAPSSFYIKSIAPQEVTMGRIYRGTLPYLCVVVVMLVIITVWQDLPLYLLRLLR
jgi:hypothetical protein